MTDKLLWNNQGQLSNKREMILMAATKLFALQGFHKTKMEEIAQEAGIGKGTIYQYFDNKKQLFQEMIKEGFRIYLSRCRDSLREGKDIFEKLTNFLNMQLTLLEHNRDMAQLLISEHSEIGQETMLWLKDVKEELMEDLQQAIQGAIDKGEIRQLNNKAVSIMFLGIVGKISSYTIHRHVGCIDQQTIDEMLDIFFRGIK